jgi:hypothetical protein
MKSIRFGYNVFSAVILPLVILLLSGCQFGQTVMISKGEAGGFSQIIGGTADYCKITSTPGVNISEAAQEAFIKYCEDTE